MLFHNIAVLVMQVAIVQVVHMVSVLDAGVPALWSMLVVMIIVYVMRHAISPFRYSSMACSNAIRTISIT